jgi:predicted nuclease with TOPRIM domain
MRMDRDLSKKTTSEIRKIASSLEAQLSEQKELAKSLRMQCEEAKLEYSRKNDIVRNLQKEIEDLEQDIVDYEKESELSLKAREEEFNAYKKEIESRILKLKKHDAHIQRIIDKTSS